MSNLKVKRTAYAQLLLAKKKRGDTWKKWGIGQEGQYILIRNSNGGTEIVYPSTIIYRATRQGWAKKLNKR